MPEGVGPGDEFEVLLDDVEASEEARIVTEDDQMIEGETASRICRACCGMRKHAGPLRDNVSILSIPTYIDMYACREQAWVC